MFDGNVPVSATTMLLTTRSLAARRAPSGLPWSSRESSLGGLPSTPRAALIRSIARLAPLHYGMVNAGWPE